MKKTYKNPHIYIVTLEKCDNIIMASQEISAYDRVISDYNSEENSLRTKINYECANIHKNWSALTKNADKAIFLKSYLDNAMNVEFMLLQDKFRYKTFDSNIKQLDDKNLLSITEKHNVNDYLDRRKIELKCIDAKQESHLTTLPEEEQCYAELRENFANVALCQLKAEIINQTTDMKHKSSAKISVIRENINLQSLSNFNYVWPSPSKAYKAVCIPTKEVTLYFYPQYLIVSKKVSDFNIVDYKNINVSFSETRFLEKETVDDAELLGITYTYINKNGERDMRFANNPMLYKYNYGELAIDIFMEEVKISKILQFSNVHKSRMFYEALTKLISIKKDNEELKEQDIIQNTSDNDVQSNKKITKEQFDLIRSESYKLADFWIECAKNKIVCDTIEEKIDWLQHNGIQWSVSEKTRTIFFMDVYNCYKGLGHNLESSNNSENIGMLISIIHYLNSDKVIDYNNIDNLMHESKNVFFELINQIKYLCNNYTVSSNDFVFQKILEGIDRDAQIQYTTLLYRFASAIANADGEISKEEEKWLSEIMQLKKKLSKNKSEVNTKKKKNTNNSIDRLNELIGLQSVKEEITKLTNFIQVQQMRKEKGMKVSDLSYHCIFTGNPGTGKTTVARIIAGIYKELGILKKGHLVETDRSGLVAEYVGQTAVKTNKIIDSAIDGVLFIDEAYSLTQGSKEDYGTEAITTLLKRMEDNRDRLVVILAGYKDEMKTFIDSNPGLQSRFNRYIEFQDYNADELMEILLQSLKNNDYTISPDAEKYMRDFLSEAVANKDENFGNARYVRNIFEKILENQAMRVASLRNITSETLAEITINDVRKL